MNAWYELNKRKLIWPIKGRDNENLNRFETWDGYDIQYIK